MTVTLDKTHELKGNGYLLGVCGENESEQFIINIAYDVLLDKWAYIEFEQNNEKYTTERLAIANGQIVYNITNGLLAQGHARVQVIFRDANGFVWKSFVRQFAVDASINACSNLPTKYPDFITEAQNLLDGITIQADKVDAVLSTEEERVKAEAERATNEATRLANETERETTEAERKTAETARITAEEQRQINEAGRVDAETARRTEFSGWAVNFGNLNTYDKRLINLEEAGVGTLFDYQEDNTTAYSKAVPAKALPYARLNKVGGAVTNETSVGKNLFNINNLELTTANYISITNISNNSITIVSNEGYEGNGYVTTTKTLRELAPFLEVGKTYVINAETTSTQKFIYLSCYNDKTHSVMLALGKPFMVTEENLQSIVCLYGIDRTNGYGYGESVISNMQIEKGTVATAYEPYKVNTYAIPATIQALDGYGTEGSYIDFERKVFVNGETVTDISAYITDNYIKVEANGSVVFENENAAAVPSEIIYAVKK